MEPLRPHRVVVSYDHEVFSLGWPIVTPATATSPPVYAPPVDPPRDQKTPVVRSLRIVGEIEVEYENDDHDAEPAVKSIQGVGTPRYTVELGIWGRRAGKRGPVEHWVVRVHMRRVCGDWLAGRMIFRCGGKRAAPSSRLQAAVSPERWRHDVEFELRHRLAFDVVADRWKAQVREDARKSGASGEELAEIERAPVMKLVPNDLIAEIVLGDWHITAPRSPRGPQPSVSPEGARVNASSMRSRQRRIGQRSLVP